MPDREFNCTPLNTNMVEILTEICALLEVKWPRRMKTNQQRRVLNKYCEFHQDYGHDMEDCVILRLEIEK